MLTLVLALISGQAAPAPPLITAAPPVFRTERLEITRPDGTRVVVRTNLCSPVLHQISPAPGAAPPFGAEQTPPQGERVRLYRLLDRHIDGCSVPVVAVDHLPDADRAVGRNLLRR